VVTIRLPFDCSSTVIRPFDNLPHDRSTCCYKHKAKQLKIADNNQNSSSHCLYFISTVKGFTRTFYEFSFVLLTFPGKFFQFSLIWRIKCSIDVTACPATGLCRRTTSDRGAWTMNRSFGDVTPVDSPSPRSSRSTRTAAGRSTSPGTSRSSATTPTTDPSTRHWFGTTPPSKSTSTTPTAAGDLAMTIPCRRRRLRGSAIQLSDRSSSPATGSYTTVETGVATLTSKSDVAVCTTPTTATDAFFRLDA